MMRGPWMIFLAGNAGGVSFDKHVRDPKLLTSCISLPKTFAICEILRVHVSRVNSA